jgi:hypothetical protein
MVTLILGVYLLLVGLVQVFSIPIPTLVMGIFALVAGIILILEVSNEHYTIGR